MVLETTHQPRIAKNVIAASTNEAQWKKLERSKTAGDASKLKSSNASLNDGTSGAQHTNLKDASNEASQTTCRPCNLAVMSEGYVQHSDACKEMTGVSPTSPVDQTATCSLGFPTSTKCSLLAGSAATTGNIDKVGPSISTNGQSVTSDSDQHETLTDFQKIKYKVQNKESLQETLQDYLEKEEETAGTATGAISPNPKLYIKDNDLPSKPVV